VLQTQFFIGFPSTWSNRIEHPNAARLHAQLSTHPTKDMSTYVHHKPYLTLNIGGASYLVNGLYPSYGMVWINYVYIYIYYEL
jgi:hypothetical protein